MDSGDATRGIRDETLAVFTQSGSPHAPLSTSEVADGLGCGRRAAYDRLTRLVDRGDLRTKKVGARGRVWWRPVEPSDAERTGRERPPRERERRFRTLVEGIEEYAIFMLDPDGHVRTWNEGAARIKGYDRGEILDEHYSVFYTEDDVEAGVPERNLASAVEDGSVEDEGWRVRADGSRFWANVTITALYDDGDLEGFAKVTRDMTERHERERQLRRERDVTDRILEVAPASIAVVDPDGGLVQANRRIDERLSVFDASADDYAVGDWDLFDETGAYVPTAERPYMQVFETGERVSDWRGQVETPDGERRWLSIDAVPLDADGNEIRWVVMSAENVTRIEDQARRLERQRADLERELDEVFERIDDAFFALDTEWRFAYVNERAEHFLERTEAELLGNSVWEEFPEAVGSTFEEEYERAMGTQRSVSFEEYYPPLDGWFEVRAYPSETGLSVYFRDVTERKERERDLERYETIVETIDDGVYVLDEEYRFTAVNEAYAGMTGYGRDELLGAHCSLVGGEETSADAAALSREMTAANGESETLEAELLCADGDRLPAESRFTALPAADGEFRGTVGVVRDLSERKERERALERSERRHRALAEHFPNGGVALFGTDLRYTLLEGTVFDDYEVPTHELVGRRVGTLAPDPETRELVERYYAAALDGETNSYEFEWNGREFQAWTRPVTDEDGNVFAGMVMTQDVTDRKRRERELEQYERIVETIWDGVYAVDGDDRFALVNEAYASMFGYEPEELLGERVSRVHGDAINEKFRRLNGEMVGGERERASVELDLRTAEGETVPTETKFGPYRIDGERYGRVGVTRDITERKRSERQLERQRERLAALDDLNAVVRDINEALVRQSTREEIERTVCERLAGSDSYRFAWIAEADSKGRSIRPRVEAGVDGYVDGIPVSIDSDDPTGRGPIGRAVRTKEIQIVDDVFADPDFEPWRDYAEEYGYRSVAVLPIVHEETFYGILGVYALRTDALADEEREVVSHLGEVVGHAIAAVDRKRALMGDEIVEIEFLLRNISEGTDVSTALDGPITFDRTVPVGDGTYLEYGTAPEDAVALLEALVERLPHWADVTVLSEEFGDVAFELRLSEPPVVSVIASHGGYVEEAAIEGGDFHMTVHLLPSVEVREITEAIRSAYPDIEMLAQRQVSRIDEAPKRIERAFTESLTEHQRAALEAAFHSGFFEWPRDSSGEEVAASLGVTASTFHQHIRLAEGKLLEALFAEPRSLRR
ncbi:PAS domain S-box protein [Halomarina halobia]|uniref:PAS domain S-box protein n=1 Tax=Halomarina halobia TaxID=3033386 RepID=A0ABD6A925_9EURY|nr:PAS domain S-box protein [Halomarina sp. PSR21]